MGKRRSQICSWPLLLAEAAVLAYPFAARADEAGSMRRSSAYARSAELMQQPIIQLLVWMRVPGDTIFSVGALLMAWFVARLWIAPRVERLPIADGVAARTPA